MRETTPSTDRLLLWKMILWYIIIGRRQKEEEKIDENHESVFKAVSKCSFVGSKQLKLAISKQSWCGRLQQDRPSQGCCWGKIQFYANMINLDARCKKAKALFWQKPFNGDIFQATLVVMARAVEVRKAGSGMHPVVMQVDISKLDQNYSWPPYFLAGGGALQGLPLHDSLSSPTCSSLPIFFSPLITLSPPPSPLLYSPASCSRSALPTTLGHYQLDGQFQAVPDSAAQDGEEGHLGKGQEAHLPYLWWVNLTSLSHFLFFTFPLYSSDENYVRKKSCWPF